MKRSGPLKRKTPLRRTAFKRKAARPNPAGSDPAHLAWIREQPCHACGGINLIHAHHSTVGRGLSRKTSDRETIPLCAWCHDEFHNARGCFKGWSRQRRTLWQNEAVSKFACGEQTV